jgi:hypothetical protein
VVLICQHLILIGIDVCALQRCPIAHMLIEVAVIRLLLARPGRGR